MSSTRDQKCRGGCGVLVARENRTGTCRKCYDAARKKEAAYQATKQAEIDAVHGPAPMPAEQVAADRERKRTLDRLSSYKGRYEEACLIIERQEHELAAMGIIGESLETFTIEPTQPSGTSEATAVLVASDWHSEERVGREVGDLNVHNLTIAKARAVKFFQKGLRLINLLKQDISIPTILLPLLGDFITGNIHGEENAEMNELQPIHALLEVQGWIASGINFLLANSSCNLILPCHSGNHARTTLKTRFGAENGHSLEFLMYKHLAAEFRHEPRVTFIIPEGMHSYVQVYDQTIRFHHGHAVKYQGGVGGIYIPVNKAISQWNKARHADLDVFGHFHQMRDGGNFICNGSSIGYNSFALSIKADYEPPKQALFLMDKKRGRTCTWPILVK